MPSEQTISRPVATWLFACAGLVFAMVIVGAITRLTNSGLSMVEWRPLIGALPPLSESEWSRVFALYQASPEYRQEHFWMGLDDFKVIFFWEWFHRLLGRLIGIAYALPLLWFWIKDMIPPGHKLKLFFLLFLGGLQGLMGWYMVQSGLVDVPSVSHYRLAAHLSLALLIFALLLWSGLSFTPLKRHPQPALYTHGWITLGIFIITMFWGAYTAGLDAGLVYNDSFPKMGGHWLPPGLWQHEPFWVNFFETHGGVQFAHRWLAIMTVLTILSFWVHGMYRKQTFPALHGLAIMAFLQMGLGIATLLSGVTLPLAILHQSGAVVILLLLVICLKQLKP